MALRSSSSTLSPCCSARNRHTSTPPDAISTTESSANATSAAELAAMPAPMPKAASTAIQPMVRYSSLRARRSRASRSAASTVVKCWQFLPRRSTEEGKIRLLEAQMHGGGTRAATHQGTVGDGFAQSLERHGLEDPAEEALLIFREQVDVDAARPTSDVERAADELVLHALRAGERPQHRAGAEALERDDAGDASVFECDDRVLD